MSSIPSYTAGRDWKYEVDGFSSRMEYEMDCIFSLESSRSQGQWKVSKLGHVYDIDPLDAGQSTK